MYEQRWYRPGTHDLRFNITMEFLGEYGKPGMRILDLGVKNPMSERMSAAGYAVTNTEGHDLDLHPGLGRAEGMDAVTAFEIFEHMVSPFPLLAGIKAPVLFASVPLKLWFSNAYVGDLDPYDKHYHEFEPWQFDLLLEKAGWRITHSKKWASGGHLGGFRPVLRYFHDRYYLVRAERISEVEIGDVA